MNRLPFDQSNDAHRHVSRRRRCGILLLAVTVFAACSLAGLLLLSYVEPPTPAATAAAAILIVLLSFEIAKECKHCLYRRDGARKAGKDGPSVTR